MPDFVIFSPFIFTEMEPSISDGRRAIRSTTGEGQRKVAGKILIVVGAVMPRQETRAARKAARPWPLTEPEDVLGSAHAARPRTYASSSQAPNGEEGPRKLVYQTRARSCCDVPSHVALPETYGTCHTSPDWLSSSTVK